MAYNSNELHVIRSFGAAETEADTGYLQVKGSIFGDAPRCPLCSSALALRVWEPPFKVEMRFWGPKYGDLVQFTNDVLVSERMVVAIQEAGLTGIDILAEATVTKVRPSRMAKGMPRYFVGRIGRSSAMFDDEASGAEYEHKWKCPKCKTGNLLRFRSVVLVANSYAGEDLFIARGLPGIFLASARFRDLVIAHGFQNVNLVRASEFGIDWFPSRKESS